MIRNLSSLIFLFVGSICLGATLHVPEDYPTIQSGINEAWEGDTIIVSEGVYIGSGNKNLDFFGKAILLQSQFGYSVTIIDCENSGRGFYIHQGENQNAIIDGFTIQNGIAPEIGGGGILCDNSSPTIVNCKFLNNYSDNWGGGAYINNSDSILNNCLFINNSSNFGGGAMYLLDSDTLSISDCQFDSNSSQLGGGLLSSRSSFEITDSIFSNNSGTGEVSQGGGAFIADGSPNLYNCVFVNNTSSLAGGIRGENSGFILINCIIDSNTATFYGGGIYYSGGGVILRGSTISNNTINSPDYNGAGIAISHSDESLVTNSTIISNTSISSGAGGLWCEDANITIDNCIISLNESVFDGGGILADENSLLNISQSIISGNSSLNGGAVAVFGSYIEMTNSLIESNNSQRGAGLYLNESGLNLRNCTITGNIASINGGSFSFDNTYPITPIIKDAILWNNSPNEIETVGSGIPIVMYSDVQLNSGIYPGVGNINQNPIFISGALGNYYLSTLDAGQAENSPCINSGSDLSSEVCFETSRLELCLNQMTTRTDLVADFSSVDMGYHYFSEGIVTPTPTNTPTSTNTGTITPTFTCTPTPTFTATPTITPTLTPYPTNSPFPTSTPYPTPTSIIPNTPTTLPTYTPDPTYTPNPTYTPLPTPICENFGTKLYMPSNEFEPGDSCFCKVYICNPNAESYFQVPLFVILEVYENLYFAPSFGDYDYFTLDVDPGLTIRTVLESFSWPQGVGVAHGIYWYSAMTNSEMTALLGEMDSFEFGWSES